MCDLCSEGTRARPDLPLMSFRCSIRYLADLKQTVGHQTKRQACEKGCAGTCRQAKL